MPFTGTTASLNMRALMPGVPGDAQLATIPYPLNSIPYAGKQRK